jgi:RimJ/RimL family protein N-acetyltransferase
MTQADFPALCQIMQDSLTMTAYEGPFTATEVQTWLDRQISNYHQYGHGLWAVMLRDSGEMIGQCGITWQDIAGKRVVEVGYLFNRNYWHQGFAIEAARAALEWAFANLDVAAVYAQVRDTNIASLNVAIRLGMSIESRFLKHYRSVDMPHFAFRVRRPAPTIPAEAAHAEAAYAVADPAEAAPE